MIIATSSGTTESKGEPGQTSYIVQGQCMFKLVSSVPQTGRGLHVIVKQIYIF